MNYFEDVKKFQREILGLSLPDTAQLLPCKTMEERVSFLVEELGELVYAFHSANLVKVADALGDIVYVALGTAAYMGLPFEEIWAAIQKANMAKVRGKTHRDQEVDACKPEGWVGPEAEIRAAIERTKNGQS